MPMCQLAARPFRRLIGTLALMHWQIDTLANYSIGTLFNWHIIHNFFSGQILFCTFAQSFSKLTLIKKNLIWEVFSEQSHKGPV